MNTKNFLLLFALFLFVVLPAGAFALSKCPAELSFDYENGKFAGQQELYDNRAANYDKAENVLSYTNLMQYCGLNKGDSITVYAEYATPGANNLPQNVKIPLLKITMADYYEDKLKETKNYSYDNDAWKFRFDLLKPDGSVLSSFEKEIWEYSGLANAAERTSISLNLPNGEPAFYIQLDLDSDMSWDGQLDKLYMKGNQDIATLIKKLASASGTAATMPVATAPATQPTTQPSTQSSTQPSVQPATQLNNILDLLFVLNKKLFSDLGLK